tara:strand:+ start:1117 stop:1770 length:654 start_codon:yes stop_codon:yes gene_type:complete
MTGSSAKDINITINAQKTEDDIENNLDETYDEFKKYIIANNVSLQKQTKRDLIEIKRLESELSLKEEEEDKNDNRIRYLKGLLQNLNEISKNYNEVAEKYKNLCNYYQTIYKESQTINYNYLLYSSLFSISISIYELANMFKFNYIYYILYNTVITLLILFLINKLSNIYKSSLYLYNKSEGISKIKILKNEILDKIKEVKKLEESTITLDNWICEI